MLTSLHLLDQKDSKQQYCEIYLEFKITFLYFNTLKCHLFLWSKLNSTSLLQSSVSRDPSEIILECWFAAQETLLSVLKTVELLNIFVETDRLFQDCLINRKFNRRALI